MILNFDPDHVKEAYKNESRFLKKAKKLLEDPDFVRSFKNVNYKISKKFNTDPCLNYSEYAVYIIRTKVSSDKVNTQFKTGKSSNRNYAHDNNTDSKTLYVGSAKDLNNRMKQHLGLSARNESTYALWLKDWFSGDVTIYYHVFPSRTEHELVQAIENIIWEIEKPKYGKKGGRGF